MPEIVGGPIRPPVNTVGGNLDMAIDAGARIQADLMDVAAPIRRENC